MTKKMPVHVETKAAINRIIDELYERKQNDVGIEQADDIALKAAELHALASQTRLVASSGLGECRRATPFSSLRPVLQDDGLYWYCSHDPVHRVKVAP